MQDLEVNVAATILIGPAVAIADGVTPVENLDIDTADHAELMKHNGTTFVDLTSDSRAFTHKEGGWYTLVLGTGDIDTEGRLTVLIMDTDLCLPIWKDFMVLSQATYASKYGAKDSGYMDVDIKAVGGTATPHTSGKLHVLDDDGGSIPTVTEIQAEMEENGQSLLDTIRDELANATDGLSALKALIDAISASAIVNALLDEDVTGHETADTVGRVIGALMGKWEVVGNQLICTGLSGNVLFTFDLTRDGEATEFNPDKREAA